MDEMQLFLIQPNQSELNTEENIVVQNYDITETQLYQNYWL